MNSRGVLDGDFGQLRPSQIPVAPVALGILLLIVALVLWTCVFTVNPEEVGVVQVFGAYSHSAEPGLCFKSPWPIATVTKVPIQQQLKEEFGFVTDQARVRSIYGRGDGKGESLMLTGDLNVAVVEWITQFRVNDPYKSLFRMRNLRDTFRDMNEAVMREVVGDRSVNEVLTIGRQEIASEVELRLQKLCDQYDTGLKVEQIVLQDVNPPDKVKPAFNEVNQAQQIKERMINEALADYNKSVPRARGEAQKTIQQAEGYATDRVNRAQGDAALFREILAAYERSPEVTRQRIYLETMNLIYPQIKNKIVLDKELKGVLPLLPLSTGVKP